MKRKLYLLLAVIAMSGSELFSQGNLVQPVNEKYIELQERVTLNYVEQGDPNGIPVILLHGFTDSWRSFELILPYVPKNIHLYAITQRGHGGSGRPHYGYAPENFANDIAAFMKNLQIRQAVIVGHSMGATVAQCFAIQYPELTKGVVLAGSFASYQSNPAVAELTRVVAGLENPVDRNFVKEFQQSTIVREVPPAFFDSVVSESAKVPARVWKSIVKEMVRVDYLEELETITMPVLLIWGDKDNFCSRSDQDALLNSIPGSKLTVYKGTGHAVQWEEPARFADDITRFSMELELLTQKTWKLVSHGMDDNGNNSIDAGEELIKDCERDNQYVFNTDGTALFLDNVLICGDGITELPFTWKLIDNGSALDFTYSILKIYELTENEMSLYYETTLNGQPVRGFTIFRH